ncbi:MAG: ABC transporter permease [Gammaproteobacteria bacterium]
MAGRVSLYFLLGCCLLALLAFVLPLSPNTISLDKILVTPEPSAWFGYDELGRPILSRVLAGASVSFTVAVAVVLISATVGTLIGTVSAFIGGRLDLLTGLITDIFLAFPGILLAIALAAILGPGINNIIIALSLVGWTGYARLARTQTLSLMQRDHIAAARSLGSGLPRMVFRHLLPLMAAPLIVEATFGIASVIIAEAGLSFLGLGVQPPEPSWGSMIREGVRYLLVAPHLVIIPGSLLFMVVFAVNILGDALRDRLDVRQH